MGENNLVNIYIFVAIVGTLMLISLLVGYCVRSCVRRKNERRAQRQRVYFENIRTIARGTSSMGRQIII